MREIVDLVGSVANALAGDAVADPGPVISARPCRLAESWLDGVPIVGVAAEARLEHDSRTPGADAVEEQTAPVADGHEAAGVATPAEGGRRRGLRRVALR